MQRQNWLSTSIWLVLLCTSCDRNARLEPEKRPVGVPNTAIWAGGADGGCYIQCRVELKLDVNRCNVWNDYTGDSTGWENYRLVTSNRAATAKELKFEGASTDYIYLQNGQVLKRLSEFKQDADKSDDRR